MSSPNSSPFVSPGTAHSVHFHGPFLEKNGRGAEQHTIYRKRTTQKFLQSDEELLTIVGPEDGSCVCGDWVGAVVSVSGTSENWPALLDALEDGVFHEGCQHRLEAYSPENQGEAEFCTELALVAMQERRRENLTRKASTSATDDTARLQQEFAKVYNAARSAEASGAFDAALSKCEAALEMLHEEDLFDVDQNRVEQVLKARIRGILSRPGSKE